jgi:transposase
LVISSVFQGSTNSSVFENFIEELLYHCGRWPEPKSSLIMDNASFHHSTTLEKICAEAGVNLVYLPPFPLDLNPIQELFAELKAFMRQYWQVYEDNPYQGFDSSLNGALLGKWPGRIHHGQRMKLSRYRVEVNYVSQIL